MGKRKRKHERSLTCWQKYYWEKKPKIAKEPEYLKEPETVMAEQEAPAEITGEQTYPRRMEIWFAQLSLREDSCIQGGDRPVLIISNDINNRNAETVNVLPMTSRSKKMNLPSHAWLAADPVTGLKHGSMVLAEQITTIDKKQLVHRMGKCSNELFQKSVHRTLYSQLGLE